MRMMLARTTLLLLLSLLLLLQRTVTAQQEQPGGVLTGFFLFDSGSDVDLRPLADGDRVDLNELNNVPLTIRAGVAGDNNNNNNNVVDSVTFDLNGGATVRLEGKAPYFLAGDTNGDAHEVNALRDLGPHTVSATARSSNGEIVGELTVQFVVMDGSVERSPTATPLSVFDVPAYDASAFGAVSGELKRWHKITLGFLGQPTAEYNNIVNPFLDLRLDCVFEHASSNENDDGGGTATTATTKQTTPQKTKFVVPGYYAADGNAANTGASSGSVWLCHFRPPLVGEWTWTARYYSGESVAVNMTNAANADFFDGETGSFQVEETDKAAPDLRARGLLQYAHRHHLQFRGDRSHFLKAGADSPENLLAYDDFDGTPNNHNRRKSWAPHLGDYREGDPTWANGKGRAIIGAVNYLSDQGMNAISFLTMNIDGDDKNVFPYVLDDDGNSDRPTDFTRFDCSKLAQWDAVLDHAEAKGLFLHFKTQETENDQLLDGGDLGVHRKLYYRELVARFGHHLALNWNLGEENTNSDEQRRQFADYFKLLDPHRHPVTMHTYPGAQEREFAPLLGHDKFDSVSLQKKPEDGFDATLEWVTRSAAADHPWVVTFDEQVPATDGVLPDAVDPRHDEIRKYVLWANFMAGGAGVEYYFGYSYDHSDMSAQDFRSRAAMWEQSKHALDFFNLNDIPFWNMVNANSLVVTTTATTAAWCLQEKGPTRRSFYVVYLPDGGTVDLDLTEVEPTASYAVQWFDPLTGGDLQTGSVATVRGGAVASLGDAPYASGGGDWAVLLRCSENCPTEAPTFAPTFAPTTSAPVVAPIATDSPVVAPTATDSPVEAPVVDTAGDTSPAPTAGPSMAPAKAATSTPVALPPVLDDRVAQDIPTATPTTSSAADDEEEKPTGSPLDPTTTTDMPTTSNASSATALLSAGRLAVVSSLGLLAAAAGVAW